jgi:hypothetical protein
MNVRRALFSLLSLSFLSVSDGKAKWWSALQTQVDNDDFAFHSDWWQGNGEKDVQGNKLHKAYWRVPVQKIRMQVGLESSGSIDIVLDPALAGKLTLRQLASLPGLTCSTQAGDLHKFLPKEKRHKKLVCSQASVNLFHENDDGLKVSSKCRNLPMHLLNFVCHFLRLKKKTSSS